jgi:hypothetical protein
MTSPLSVVAVDGGDLPLGGGLLALLRPALSLLRPGGQLALLSSAPSVAHDLPAWCRVEHHVYLGAEAMADGRTTHRLERGPLGVPRPGDVGVPERADPSTGFAPRGADVEPGGPVYPFTLVERDHVIPPEVGSLYEQAITSQWVASRDIPWSTVKPLPDALERAVGQTMTFLAENELSALYVPANFLPRIHPAYAEVAMFLATQLNDEARHIEVFLRRARSGGGTLGVSSVTTGGVPALGARRRDVPRPPEICRALRARRGDPDPDGKSTGGRDAPRPFRAGPRAPRAQKRSAPLRPARGGGAEAGGRRVPAPLADALTLLAAGGADPRGVRKGHEAFRELIETMHQNRIKRLEHAGFSPEQAKTLSDLHTPNFM